ncbi:hypothetical protein ABT063_47095 [Streptomyces sp. NPDC002838]|uniref:hypothetical protein n=1 Tax=Streptomyces sp. NPDC002838 TaxID=3154436 RepID=UPI003329D137
MSSTPSGRGLSCTVQFTVAPPAHWTASLTRRVQRHFLAFGLGELYALQASDELVGLHERFVDLAEQGPDVLRTFLAEIADSQVAARKNRWQTALFRARSQSAWFCTGRFIPA